MNDSMDDPATHAPARAAEWGTLGRRWADTVRYLRRNPSLGVGLALIVLLGVVALGGRLFIDPNIARPLAAPPSRPPSWIYPFGTDMQGRNLLGVLIVGTYLTLKVGLIAGFLGIAIGAVLGFVAAFYGGWVDRVINLVVDVLLTVPALLFLVVIAANVTRNMTTDQMAIIVALLAWRQPTRQIRSQALVMRELGYVQTARLSGTNSLGIIFKELMPNLIPYLMASFVLATSTAILASVGLEALGLGPQDEPTLGMTVFWVMYNSAFMLGMWWWVMTPVVALVVLFIGLYLMSAGLDELANPRLRRKGAA
jgi:peptide/nickel transport system permease protein